MADLAFEIWRRMSMSSLSRGSTREPKYLNFLLKVTVLSETLKGAVRGDESYFAMMLARE